MKTCAVIPAAGLGTRLGGDVPKLLLPLSDTETVWSHMRRALSFLDHLHVIASPTGFAAIAQALRADIECGFASVSVQSEPRGMGDALFCGYPVWSQAQSIVVVWGDQAGVSASTLQKTVALLEERGGRAVLPRVLLNQPYVEYVFDATGVLQSVHQSREGEAVAARGWSDVGVFGLKVAGLREAWQHFMQEASQGARTREVNFLPFLPFLARQGWDICTLTVNDPQEARGINTLDDLLFFRENAAGVYS